MTTSQAEPPLEVNWVFFLLSGLIGLAAWMARENALAAAVVCMNFASQDRRNSVWLWRNDRNRRRAWVLSALYLARGLFRFAVRALALGVVLEACFHLPFGMGETPVSSSLVLLLDVVFLILAAVMTWVAIRCAWRGRLKLWIDPCVAWSRLGNNFPPNTFGENEVARLTDYTIATGLIASICSICAAWWIGAVYEWDRMPQQWALAIGLLLLVSLSVGLLILLLVDARFLRNCAATCPTECWPELAATRSERGVEIFE